MATYAVMDVTNTTIVNLADCNNQAFATAQGWLGPVTPSATIQIGSTTPDGGVTWVAPVIPPAVANIPVIEANLLAQLAVIETWIAAHPTGATLTAAQTLTVAQMLSGLVRILLQDTASIGGS